MSNPEDRRIARLRRPQIVQSADNHEPTVTDSNASAAERSGSERLARRLERAKLRAAKAQATSALAAGAPAAREERQTAQQILRQRQRPVDLPRPNVTINFPPLPHRKRKRSFAGLISFLICVVLPVVAASVYYIGYAADQYSAGFKFVVRDAKTAAGGSSSAGIPSLFGAGGMPTNSVENYMVAEYITSRQAVDAIQKKIDVRSMYANPNADWFARFNNAEPIERFVSYWRRMVSANYDQVTGLGSAEVRAFTAEDAYRIAATLVTLSEELVNDIANRPQRDAVKFAENDVNRAEERLRAIRAQLTQFRNNEQVIEPQANIVTSNTLLAQTLRANLNQMETELSALTKQNLSPNAPVSVVLQNRIKATREQLALVDAQVGTTRDGSTPLSKVVADYEFLDLERQFAQNMVLTTMQALEQARAAALTQHVYVTTFVSPALPQSSTFPKRVTAILIVALACMLFWTIGVLIVGSVREHLT
jgi:capsular polysaccharide transport system permease protein